MFYFYLIVIFLIMTALGLFGISITPKGKSVFEDIWVFIKSKFSKTVKVEDAVCGDVIYEDDSVIARVKTSGAIVPIDGYITYFIDTDRKSRTIDHTKVTSLMRSGFDILTPLMGKVRFKEVFDRSQAQIILGFWRNGMTGLKVQFGSTTLAYAYLANNTNSVGLTSDVFMNDAYSWHEAVIAPSGKVSFLKVFIHEVLHAMGLHHSEDPKDILYYRYNPTNNILLTDDTKNTVIELYKNYDGPTDVEDPNDEEPCPDISKVLSKTITGYNTSILKKLKEIETLTNNINQKIQ